MSCQRGLSFWYKGEIPGGWEEVVADTPAVGGKFIIASGAGYNIGQTGGLASVSLNGNQLPSHGHGVSNVTPKANPTQHTEPATHTHADTINNSHDAAHNHTTNNGARMHDNDSSHTHTAGKGETKNTAHNHTGTTDSKSTPHGHSPTVNDSSTHGHNIESAIRGGGSHTVNANTWHFSGKARVGTTGGDDAYGEVKGAASNSAYIVNPSPTHDHLASFWFWRWT